MKGETKVFAILTILFLLFLSPGISSADPSVNSPNSALSTAPTSNTVSIVSYFERVLLDGIWWIFGYDGGTLIDSYPE